MIGARYALFSLWSGLAASLVVAVPAGAAHAGGPHALFIIDANTGATLADQDGNDPRYPASLTKMMTLYLVFERLEQGKLSMRTRIPISAHAANAAPSKLELAVGDEISVEDAIATLITKSANDVAIALAEQIGGSEPEFAKMMTAKARVLGMKATTFKNASGLPDGSQTTTARDMTTLGLHLYDDFPRYFPMFATRAHTYNGATHKNHNTLMLQMPGINGIKTGYTHASGFNLVSSYQQDGKHLIGAIFGGETAGSRNALMRVALTRALAKASTGRTRKPVLVARAELVNRPKPAPVAAAVAQPPVTPVAVVAAPPAAPAPAPLKIEMAKVRPVAVADAAPSARATPAERPAFAQASATPRMSDVIKSRVATPEIAPLAPVAGPDVAVTGVRAPSSFEQQVAGMAQNIQPAQPAAVAPAVAPGVAAVAPAVPAAIVRPPSTLGAQLEQLGPQPGAKMAQPSYRLQGPAAAPRAPVETGFEIQIGAYASPSEADKRLAAAQTQVPALAGRVPVRRPVTMGEKTLYRARFAGFDAASAQAACAALNRQAINCLALKAE